MNIKWAHQAIRTCHATPRTHARARTHTCERLWCVVNIKCHIKFQTINFNHQRTSKTKPLTKNYNSYGFARTHARIHSGPNIDDSNVCMCILVVYVYIDIAHGHDRNIYAENAWWRRWRRQRSQSPWYLAAHTPKTNQQSTLWTAHINSPISRTRRSVVHHFMCIHTWHFQAH